MSIAKELRQPSLAQVQKNHIKVLRAAIRLKHSIAADNELEHLIPEVNRRLAKQMAEGYVDGLTVGQMLALVEGYE